MNGIIFSTEVDIEENYQAKSRKAGLLNFIR